MSLKKISWVQEPVHSVKTFRCPCCKYKTLRGRGHNEICPVCFWEDDGQNEIAADEVLGGPNSNLSLRQAQENFARIGASDEKDLPHIRQPQLDEH